MTDEIIKLLPLNYQNYIKSENLDPFLKTYFININKIVTRLWDDKVSKDIDCRGIIFFSKCLVKSITRPTSTDDKLFLKAIRKIKPTKISQKRSKSIEPKY